VGSNIVKGGGPLKRKEELGTSWRGIKREEGNVKDLKKETEWGETVPSPSIEQGCTSKGRRLQEEEINQKEATPLIRRHKVERRFGVV